MQEWWRPERFAARRERLERRGRMLGAVRGFFAARGFVEVDTPALQASPGLEPHLQAFATTLHDPRDGRTVPRYLHTSPEFAMKKLLAAGHAADLAAGPCVSQRRAQRHASPRILDDRMVPGRRRLP